MSDLHRGHRGDALALHRRPRTTAGVILPWDDRTYDEQMPLSRIGSLLPYHTHVDVSTVTSALNRMVDDVAGGQAVFYRFYGDARRQQ